MLCELIREGAAGPRQVSTLMASKALTRLLAPLLDWYAPRYQAAVADVLRKHGLRYEDLYDPLLNQVHSHRQALVYGLHRGIINLLAYDLEGPAGITPQGMPVQIKEAGCSPVNLFMAKILSQV